MTMRKQVLVADDDQMQRQLVRATLEGESIEILEAEDGQQALSLIEQLHPALVLLDCLMPELDGFEVCRSIRQRGLPITVVMLTVKSRPSDRRRGLLAGADHYLTKPFSPLELLNLVEEALAKP